MDANDSNPIKDLLRHVKVGEETVFDVVRDTLPDGTPRTVLNVVSREMNPEPPLEPDLARSPRRAHVFHAAEALVAYLKKYRSIDTVILADAVNEVVTAVLDETECTGFEMVTFKPQRHPLFTPWLAMLGKWIPLRAAVDFLLDNRRTITHPDGRGLARTLSQIKVSKKVEMMQGIGTKSINGVMIEQNIGGKNQSGSVELPEDIAIHVPMFIGCQPVDMIFDVSIDSSDEHGVVIRLSSPDIQVKASQQFEQFVKTISNDLGGECTVGLGRVTHEDWKVIRA